MSHILVLIAAFSWALIGLFTKAIEATGLSELDALVVKGVVGAVAFVAMAFCKNKKSLCLYRPSHILYFVGTGLFSFVLFSWCFMKAINMTSAGVAVVLLYTAPAIIMVYSAIFLKERMTKRKVVVLLMTLAGCTLVSEFWKSGSQVTLAGLGVGLMAGFGYALYSIFGSAAIKCGYSSETITAYTFVLASIALLCINSPVALVPKINMTNSWGLLIVFSLLTTVVPFFCYTKGLVNLPASVASVIATIEPVVAAILGILVLHESAGAAKILGIVLIIGGVFLLNIQPKNKLQE